MKTNDRPITDILKAVDEGKAQLPDFQRSWVWDDDRIKALIVSVIHCYPVGAAMFLEYGNENIRFKYRTIEGSSANGKGVVPTELILDGQQRITSLYSALYSTKPVKTCTKTEKGKEILRYYYIDIRKALDSDADDDEIVISVPETRQKTGVFGRNIEIDLSTQEKEFENMMFPLNKIFNMREVMLWQNNYQAYYKYDPVLSELFFNFTQKIVTRILNYSMPVITLEKDTPKEAVCRVFENVNTGGVSLTVFELVVASYSADDYELRKDWEDRKNNNFCGDILEVVTSTDFLTALTLLSTYYRKQNNEKVAVSCKKKDVLSLSLSEYKKYADLLTNGFIEAEKLLQEERIFSSRDLPYTTQLVPLAAICSVLIDDKKIKIANVKNKIKQWYWCGVFGELYGSANETRFANDIVQVVEWINGGTELPKTYQESFFNPTRLLGLQTRQSAAYKGIMALILKCHSKDFISGREMDFAVYKSEYIDIHHVFPRAFCETNNFPKKKWNSIINKTPISYSTNREIGGAAPSKYLEKIKKKGQVESDVLDSYLTTHLIDPELLKTDDFDMFILDRAKKILDAIQKATGKIITGRDSEEVIEQFGDKLI